ncbi:NADH-quinone oxidoreductase subunit NuoH [Candidatus Aminicenantes bacterium AH-873-B07]|nr:NADH-quinone oxidoreductase subunit NuoH [Candidatus Aminicenantes bacterium AH-873-B07]
MNIFVDYILIPIIKILFIITFVFVAVLILIWLERRFQGFIQSRLGPNRVGPQGILQSIADALKLLTKEDVVPHQVDKFIFNLSPIIVFVTALVVFAFIPFGTDLTLFGKKISLYLADLNVGLLFIIGFNSIGVFGIILGGWAAKSKYPLLGSLRSASQMISYEVALIMSLVSVLFFTRSLSLVEIVKAQQEMKVWFAFIQPVALFIFFVAGVAESNRLPFDLPEAESELVGGFHTEYSGMKFAFYFVAEFAHILFFSALVTILFFGGWLRPFPNVSWLSFLDYIPPVFWFLGKLAFFVFLFMWMRATWPRYRYDQLEMISWKWLIPLALANIFITGFIVILVK